MVAARKTQGRQLQIDVAHNVRRSRRSSLLGTRFTRGSTKTVCRLRHPKTIARPKTPKCPYMYRKFGCVVLDHPMNGGIPAPSSRRFSDRRQSCSVPAANTPAASFRTEWRPAFSYVPLLRDGRHAVKNLSRFCSRSVPQGFAIPQERQSPDWRSHSVQLLGPLRSAIRHSASHPHSRSHTGKRYFVSSPFVGWSSGPALDTGPEAFLRGYPSSTSRDQSARYARLQ